MIVTKPNKTATSAKAPWMILNFRDRINSFSHKLSKAGHERPVQVQLQAVRPIDGKDFFTFMHNEAVRHGNGISA
ncbi:MAG TPA: hypothetical protein VHK70_10670 [Burkholderiaceae bacterium]|jgi:hypothetical protein|nr:hypothetical protein [Burkholderiaceae bacterium]